MVDREAIARLIDSNHESIVTLALRIELPTALPLTRQFLFSPRTQDFSHFADRERLSVLNHRSVKTF
jgi:hypothetical protein